MIAKTPGDLVDSRSDQTPPQIQSSLFSKIVVRIHVFLLSHPSPRLFLDYNL